MARHVPNHQLCPWGQGMEGSFYRQVREEQGKDLGLMWVEEQDSGFEHSTHLNTAPPTPPYASILTSIPGAESQARAKVR